MFYIYDTFFTEAPDSVMRYGFRYNLEKRTRMGDQTFYTYRGSSEHDKLLVIPFFAGQYYELKAICEKFHTGRSQEDCERFIKRYIDEDYEMDLYPNEETQSGTMVGFTVKYKDISVVLEYADGVLRVPDGFEIVQHNIFGNGMFIQMNVPMEG